MKRIFRLGLILLCGCAPPAGPPPAAIVPLPTLVPVDFTVAWTARDGVILVQGEGEATYLPRVFTRLEVLGREYGGLKVRCDRCLIPVEGIVSPTDVIYMPLPPEVAAWGTLAEFALSIRAAAESRDLDALRPAMISDFSFSLIGPQNPTAAIDVWRSEEFRALEEVPTLLDDGLATRDSVIWSAPPAYTDDLYYRGPRVGFRRRQDGRWEWLFLMSGLTR